MNRGEELTRREERWGGGF